MKPGVSAERWPTQLQQGLIALGLELTPGQQRKLCDYLALLQKWNRAYNLTAVRDDAELVPRHLLDSLAILPFLQGSRALDVGTGAGLPGIPLAVACPERSFTLLDANGKKTRFVQQAKMELGLGNVEVVQMRAEEYQPDVHYPTVVARAFAALPQIWDWVAHLLEPDGLLLAMKGVVPDAEIAELAERGVAVEIRSLAVPGIDGQRHALLCRRA
jgi:16S rRNA (guanine527-N7)-methyltransferase